RGDAGSQMLPQGPETRSVTGFFEKTKAKISKYADTLSSARYNVPVHLQCAAVGHSARDHCNPSLGVVEYERMITDVDRFRAVRQCRNGDRPVVRSISSLDRKWATDDPERVSMRVNAVKARWVERGQSQGDIAHRRVRKYDAVSQSYVLRCTGEHNQSGTGRDPFTDAQRLE